MCSAALDLAPVLGSVLAFPVGVRHPKVRAALRRRRNWRAKRKEFSDREISNRYVDIAVRAPKPSRHYVRTKGGKDYSNRHDAYLVVTTSIDLDPLVIGFGKVHGEPFTKTHQVARSAWDLFPSAVRKRLRSLGLNRTTFAHCFTDLLAELFHPTVQPSNNWPVRITLDWFDDVRQDDGTLFPPMLYAEGPISQFGKWKMKTLASAVLREWRGIRA